MFAEKFDALMNIAEVSNSLLGRDINMNSSHIGRLRSGSRPLPKKHEYLPAICRYLAGHIKKDYQIQALQKLTGISSATLDSLERTSLYLEHWLLEQEYDTSQAAGRLISGFYKSSSRPTEVSEYELSVNAPQKLASYLYGNAGKRKAVEQFFTMILQEETPQTLLLFSDENMSWLYEDAAFSLKWTKLFTKVILRGNRVRIIHTISRDMNEMLEAVIKWIPIYMTGMIEPYYYSRLRDGIFQRTLFIAPKTAAVVSSSIRQDTDRMLNMFITDKSALEALQEEYEHYLSLCRPLMHIYTAQNEKMYRKATLNLAMTDDASYLVSAMPPLFTAPKRLICELTKQSGNESLHLKWKQSFMFFQKNIKNRHITLVMLNPESIMPDTEELYPAVGDLTETDIAHYTKEQYLEHIAYLTQLENTYENLSFCFVKDISDNMQLYVKANTGVIMAKSTAPKTSFVINERNMANAFWDYLEKCVLL